ncbi:hypothetical protein E9529_07895 [Blastococcus sp. KM273128]|uniref:hypothetical protein n=1 Tax=Blastococcus sp. KM273128 TaxID=2570314 RepID=UPI002714C0B4|nr:hypothetical protein [Blastococcus sp. KM273128]MCF6744197.1 hypothetical protein [Blastococcus sp. KM273128]
MTTLRPALRRLRLRLVPVPAQALGLALLVVVLAATLVSAPLMVAGAEQGAWEQERERLGETVVGATLGSSTQARRLRPGDAPVSRATDFADAVTAAARQAGVGRDGLGAPTTFTRLMDPMAWFAPGGAGPVELVSLTGAAEHVEVVAGAADGTGVLVPEELAAAAGVGPGDGLTVAAEGSPDSPELRVSGVYAAPQAPYPGFWAPYGYLHRPVWNPQSGNLEYPPPVVIAPLDLAVSTAATLDRDLFLEWFLPLQPGLPVARVRTAVGAVERLQVTMASPDSAVAQLLDEEGYQAPVARSGLPTVLDRVDTTRALLEPPVRAVGIGGGAAALVLVGAWAAHRVRRRDDELRSLVVRGLSPARAALHAAAEAALPVAAGLAAGGLAGWALVRELGPSTTLPSGALPQALAFLAAGGAAALAVVALVTAGLTARLDSIGSGAAAHLLGRVPWLAVTAVVTVVAAVPLVVGDPADRAGRIDVLALVVPLLVTVVVAGALTAVLPRLAVAAGGRLRGLPVGAFLAVRRVLAGQGAARVVVVTTALSLALVVYAGALASSTARTVEVKAAVATGSDVVVPLGGQGATGLRPPDGTAVVGTENDAALLPGDTGTDVLVVRPEEVAGVVRWDDGLADRPLDELMADLAAYRGDRVPVLLAGPVPDSLLEATGGELTLDFDYYSLPVQVVGRTAAFPGQGSSEPLAVADWDAYVAALETAGRDPALVLAREAWVRGTPGAALDSLAAAGYQADPARAVRTAAEFAARPELAAQTWSLAYLRAVALAAGVLGLVGLAMHAVAQQRRRTVAALLLRRMGLDRRASDAASGAEIGLLAGLAALVAVLVALPASALVLRVLDPLPALQPGAVFAVPRAALAVVAGGVVLVTAVGSWLVGRTARRATGGQVMRDAT